MKLLKIENKLGYYLKESEDYEPVDKITKDQLLRLVDLTLANDVEFDEYDDKQIQHQAHRIVYKSLYEKLRSLQERKQEFMDESEQLYRQDYEKYREESSQQGASSNR
uniref:Uncharacterized protein n=1 Tax=Candidatus Kentrum sp. UNK TaxID=2126344 RepID=A0A451AQB3_9GAMM|nr:MAG: hypothetical protein BECKUNK1418G_GA0071005_12163 [Candidatus Kentron sp. UNK]VFK73564.1 MAG: hypothetical protein BECKUNK1418H_GA0071006_12197 [Candidatus Kentron sp. UNK]